MNPWRAAAGLIVAPLAGLLILAGIGAILRPEADAMSMFGFALYITYAIELVFGLPVLLAFALFKWRRWWQFLVGGALIGPLAVATIHTPPGYRPPDAASGWSFPEFFAGMVRNLTYDVSTTRNQALFGACVALIFWFVALCEPRKAPGRCSPEI